MTPINLEIALLARQYSPNVRVVARLSNDVLREAVAAVNGPGAILDVAELATPSVVEAVLSRYTHQFDTAGMEFVVWGSEAPYDATLREIYADLAPVAVVHGKNSPSPGEVVPCPGRDLHVYAGDWTSMIGVKDELEARGIKVPPPTARRSRHSRVRRVIDAARAMRDDVNPLLFPSLAFALLLVLGSTASWLTTNPRMTWIDALYFASETITTVGYGDFSFAQQSTAPATVRCRADVRWSDRYRHPRRFPGGPAAVAPLRPNGRTPTGTPYARPRRRCRTGFSWHPRRQ